MGIKTDEWVYKPKGYKGTGPSYTLKPLNRKGRIAARLAIDSGDGLMLADLCERFYNIYVVSQENTEKLTDREIESAMQSVFFELVNQAYVSPDDKKKS